MEKAKSIAVITGASSGIGRAMAFKLAKEGYDLILIARRMDMLKLLKEELYSEYGCNTEIYGVDLRCNTEIESFCHMIKYRNIDIFINNAGIGICGEFVYTDIEKNKEIIDVNITALMKLNWTMSKVMKNRGKGIILNVASTGAYEPGPLTSVYYASKAFVLSFSEALHRELKPYNVLVSVLCPGTTKSEFACNSGKVQLENAMSAEKVAAIAYNGIIRGKRLIIPGIINKVAIFICKILPGSFTSYMVEKIQKKAIKEYKLEGEYNGVKSTKNS